MKKSTCKTLLVFMFILDVILFIHYIHRECKCKTLPVESCQETAEPQKTKIIEVESSGVVIIIRK